MNFTFVHTADWQIGKRFGRFPAEHAALLGQARLDAVDRLADAAGAAGAAQVLVAGDIFETATPDPQTRRKLFERLKRHSSLHWRLLPGNHDPAQSGGLWERCSAEGLPHNVTLHCENVACEIADQVWLLPAPLGSRAVADDPIAWMEQAATPAGATRIGLAHAGVSGFGGEGPRLVDLARVERAGLAYLALGDWHGKKEVGPRAWYSGTPEPDRFKENDPGFALAVTLPGPLARPRVVAVPTARYRWAERTARVETAADIDALDRDVRGLCDDSGNLLLALKVEGLVSLAERVLFERQLERLAAALFHLDVNLSGLRVRAEAGDLDRIDRAGELRAAAERLVALARDDSDPEAETARRALTRLYAWASGSAA